MVDSITLTTTAREKFGKGAARQLRRDGLIPAVVYGHGGETTHIALEAHETFLAVRSNANALITVKVAGKNQLTLLKDVQRNPVSRIIEHIDLLAIRAGELVDVTVPVTTVGEPASGTVVTTEVLHLAIKAPADAIPEAIEIDVEGKEEGTQIRVADVDFPKGVTTDIEEDELLVSVNFPIVDTELEEADAAAAEAAAEEDESGSDDSDEKSDEDSSDE